MAGASTSGSWQEQLLDYCNARQFRPPVFSISSDRRGGRTAWSSAVTVEGQLVNARFWYDGQNVHNAKEDAAEVALKRLQGIPLPTSSGQGQYQGQLQPDQQGQQPGQQQGHYGAYAG